VAQFDFGVAVEIWVPGQDDIFVDLGSVPDSNLGLYRPLFPVMKMIAEYLERALSFERMAATETNPAIKALFEKQATAYRKLIADRTKELGLDDPRYLNNPR
jgi:hypothetical protein